jgi:hypothetical protein
VTLRLGPLRVPAFRACGYAGLAAAVTVAMSVSEASGLVLWHEAVIVAAAVASFQALARIERLVRRHEALVYYHHEIAVLAVCGALVAALGAPILAHLDATALGLGAFLACGRIGCLLAGCCHGRPARVGVTYGPRHAAHGFSRHLVGVPLVPVQALEAAAVAALVGAGVAVAGTAPGAGFALYVGGYAVLRFCLEDLRGDAVRPSWRGLSEAQWTSLAVAIALAVAAGGDLLPGDPVHVIAAAGLAVAAAVRLARGPRLLDARHLGELAAALARLPAGRPRVLATSRGLRISAGRTEHKVHYTLSRAPVPLGAAECRALARCLLRLRHPGNRAHVVAGVAGTVHVIVDPPERSIDV